MYHNFCKHFLQGWGVGGYNYRTSTVQDALPKPKKSNLTVILSYIFEPPIPV